MPVRFRCVYCNQLLGISRRKAGTVVKCTNCEGQIIVPEPEQAVAAGSQRSADPKEHLPLGNDLFERHDIDALLKPFEFDSPQAVAAPAQHPQPLLSPGPEPTAVETARVPKAQLIRVAVITGWILTAVVMFIAGYV